MSVTSKLSLINLNDYNLTNIEERNIENIPNIIYELNKIDSKICGIFIEYLYSYYVSKKINVLNKNFLTYNTKNNEYVQFIYKKFNITTNLNPVEMYITKANIKNKAIFYSIINIINHFEKYGIDYNYDVFVNYILNNNIKELKQYLKNNIQCNESCQFSVPIQNNKIEKIGMIHGEIDMILDNIIVDIKVTKKLNYNKYIKQLLIYYYNYTIPLKGIMLINFMLGKIIYIELNKIDINIKTDSMYNMELSFNTTKTKLLKYCKKNNIKANQKMSKKEIEKLILSSVKN